MGGMSQIALVKVIDGDKDCLKGQIVTELKCFEKLAWVIEYFILKI